MSLYIRVSGRSWSESAGNLIFELHASPGTLDQPSLFKLLSHWPGHGERKIQSLRGGCLQSRAVIKAWPLAISYSATCT